MNLVQYFNAQGFRTTSDPNLYASGVWGLRNYTVNGYNYDNYCNGYHRAYDFAKGHLNNVPSPCDGEILSGTTGWGNFGGQVVIGTKDKKYQIIIGHLARNIPVRVGQKVKRGQTIGRQSNTNFDNVYMASHIHVQMQPYGYLSEWQFVCTGINPLNIDLGGGKTSVKTDVLTYEDAWDYSGKVKLTANTNYRIYPHTDAPREATIKKGTTLSFDRIYISDGHWWIRTTYDDGIWFVAVGKRNKKKTFLQLLDDGDFWVDGIGKVNTSGGKVKGKKNTYQFGQEAVINTPVTTPKKTFNMHQNRPLSSGAYVMGTIDSLGAEVRNRNGNDFSRKAGYDLQPGATVYIFQVINGWGKIYTSRTSGHGANDWIWLGRMRVQYIYK